MTRGVTLNHNADPRFGSDVVARLLQGAYRIRRIGFAQDRDHELLIELVFSQPAMR
jgi:hypothetical protein